MLNQNLSKTLSCAGFHIVIGIMVLIIDAFTGPFLMFPILFVLPVSLAAWYCNLNLSLGLAIILPVGRAIIVLMLEQTMPIQFILLNALIRIFVLVFIAYFVHRTAEQNRALEKKVQVLEGILPICMFCKKIRNKQDVWQQLEAYISQNSEADFSHGLCPKCAKEHYGYEAPKS